LKTTPQRPFYNLLSIDLSDDEFGLINFETYNMIPNVNASNNKFYFDDVEITVPEGSYEL